MICKLPYYSNSYTSVFNCFNIHFHMQINVLLLISFHC
nr:MAG TPA: hypothetical protein [Caudoviricetes sp.]